MKTAVRFVPAVCFLMAIGFTAHAQSPAALTNWEVVASPQVPIHGLAYQNGRFVAAGGTNILVSTNGAQWSFVSSGLTNFFDYLRAVGEGAGQFVAVGAPSGVILSSPDGLQWTRRHTLNGAEFWGVTYGRGTFVAAGFRNMGSFLTAIAATSPDGIQWETFTLPILTTPRNVAYGNGVFVAVGSPISMLSTNGRDWTPINSLLAQGIAYGNGRFIATLIRSGFSSTNGIDWMEFPLPGPGDTSQNYYSAGFANGTFIAGGADGRYGLLASVSDGGTQPLLPPATSTNMGAIRDVIFVDGHFYLADQGGRIWRSGRLAPVQPPTITRIARTDGESRITFSAPAGFRYALESTERLDVPDWQFHGAPVYAVEAEASITDVAPTGATRFYRVRIE